MKMTRLEKQDLLRKIKELVDGAENIEYNFTRNVEFAEMQEQLTIHKPSPIIDVYLELTPPVVKAKRRIR
jgi:hypothetical protein